ncbi:MAG: Ig-like domain-containing protein, partial [Pseudomonas sp.]|uniref:Ig-like domain-containing protein n=1 Tax=Pseudomonas sp. TaxID=306 RepID=UPI003BB48E80
VTGLAIGDFTVANGALSGLSSGDGGITWTAILTPTTSITDPSNLITLDNTGITDVTGNTGTGNTDSNNYAIDTTRPTATIVVADSTLSAGETSLVTITFSEAVSGFSNADLTVANGNLSAVSSGDGGITWTAILTPSASLVDASNLITLDNTGVSDSAGNTGSGTTDAGNYAINTVRPTATIVVADSSLTAGETSLVTITFSEAVSGFSNADLTVANGSLSAVSSSDGGITWTATLTPTSNITDASNLITLDNTGVSNAAGNTGSGSTASNNYSIDTVEALVIDNGDPEFRAYPTVVVADVPTTPLQPAVPPAPSPNISPLLLPPLFEPPTLGSGIPTLGNIFINNGALAPSFLAQVFAGNSSDAAGDGSGVGFLGFGGGDGGVFGASTLSNIFGVDSLPESTPLNIFDDRQWDENAEQNPRGVLGAPTLGQQLHEMRTTEQRQLRELALALGQFEGAKPQA